MSLLSSFITNQLIKAFENEFLNHAPEMQQFFVKEVEQFGNTIINWVQDKIEDKKPEEPK